MATPTIRELQQLGPQEFHRLSLRTLLEYRTVIERAMTDFIRATGMGHFDDPQYVTQQYYWLQQLNQQYCLRIIEVRLVQINREMPFKTLAINAFPIHQPFLFN